jgi:hypothetical protein
MRRWWMGLAWAVLLLLGAVPCAQAAGSGPLGEAGTPTRPRTHTHPLLGTESRSLNWSGYDVTGGPFTTVTATWTQPAVKPTGDDLTDVAFWVGLDGDGSGSVEQIGTEGYSAGVAVYDAWYEMYPGAPVVIGMSIHPGDVMTGTVTWSRPATFTLSLVNHTTSKTFSTTQLMNVPPALASAEIIVEAPMSSSGDIVPIPDFIRCDFTDCAVDGQPLGTYDWNRMTMVDEDGARRDKVLALGGDGASFTVATDLTPPFTTVVGGTRQFSRWHNEPVSIAFEATDDSSGVEATKSSTDRGATWTTGTSLIVDAPADHHGDGVTPVRYRSIDNVRNVEPLQLVRVRIDTQQPTPTGTSAVSVRRGHLAILPYRIDDPRPGSPTALVKIVIREQSGQVVWHAALPRRLVDTDLAYSFTCRLPRGSYSYSVGAIDAAGNRQTARALGSLAVK